jgi:DNA-binding beta-propeller fold protein YncE
MRFPAFAAACLALGISCVHAQSTIGIFPIAGWSPITVNPVTHRAYMADAARSAIDVVDGTRVVATIALAHAPSSLAVNSPFNLIYAVDGDDGVLSIIDGNTNAVTNLAIGAAGPLVVNELRNRVYVGARGGGGMLSMEGHGTDVKAIAVGGAACGAQMNPQTDQLYVVNCDDHASIVDTVGGQVTTFAIPGAQHVLAVNRQSNRAYVVGNETPQWLTVIDGNSKTAHSVAIPSMMGTDWHGVQVVASSNGNRVYIVRGYELSVLDAGSETFSLLSYTYDPIRAIAIDDNIGRVMVLDGDRRLLSIDNANRMNVTDSGVDGRALAIDTGNNHMYVLGSGNAALLDIGYFAPIPRNYQGLWWNPSESGWGVTIAQQGNTWFAAWYTYDEFGHPAWFVMPNAKANSSGGDTFGGTLYRVTGSPYTGAFDPSKTNATVVGFLTFHFTDANDGTLDATVNSAHITKPITRQSWGPMPTCELGTPLGGLPNFTDLWWRWNESGWGVFLTQQGDNIFLAWYTYDTDGTPMWLVGSNIVKTGNMTYSGTLYRTTGPPFTASPWNAAQVTAMPVGTATLQFSGLDAGTFSYTVGGVSGQKLIGREMYSSPTTYCR